MNKKTIDYTEYAGKILEALPKGILLTTKAGTKTNSMVIGWGTLGTNWDRPVFAVYVRESRFTRQLLDENPAFTINVPLDDIDPRVLSICGSRSGRDMDKLEAAGLTPVAPSVINVPGLKELPITLECRVIYRQPQELPLLDKEIAGRYYPPISDGQGGEAYDTHVTYYGEIVAAYVIEE